MLMVNCLQEWTALWNRSLQDCMRCCEVEVAQVDSQLSVIMTVTLLLGS